MQGFHSLKESKEDQREKKENKADAVQGVCFSFCSAAGGVDAPLVESAGERVDLQEVELQLSLPSEFQHH